MEDVNFTFKCILLRWDIFIQFISHPLAGI